jgi:hypothetical protein
MNYHLRCASAIEVGFARRSFNEGGLAKKDNHLQRVTIAQTFFSLFLFS